MIVAMFLSVLRIRLRLVAGFGPAWRGVMLVVLVGWLDNVRASNAVPDFERDVAPLLVSRCVECHNSSDLRGELDLTQAATALRRESPVIVPGDLDLSPVWQLVSSDQMPPKHPLTLEEKKVLESWILSGASWGNRTRLDRFGTTTPTRAGKDWWSLKPISRPPLPPTRLDWGNNPVDRFILAKLEAAGLGPAEPAAKDKLIRRVYFDLIGLPPNPAELQEALQDRRPDAYERLVDRLLASPHYGERWARHWLDVARYTESQGFEYDRFRPNAWHYRDYVIRAWNQDKPYNVFLQEQIAGDVASFDPVQPDLTADGIIATSLLVCGPWDQAGNSQANATQRMITREDELEDLVSVVGQTFLGLTINCARCHSHKFDPISHEDYARFKSIFAGVRHGERSYLTEKEIHHREQQVLRCQEKIRYREAQVEELNGRGRRRAIAQKVPPDQQALVVSEPVARWTFEKDAHDHVGGYEGELVGGAMLQGGRLIVSGESQFLRTSPLKQDLIEKTLEAWVDLAEVEQQGGGVLTVESLDGSQFDSIVFGERQRGKWIAGSAGFERTQDLEADPETRSNGDLIHIVIVYGADNSIAVYRDGQPYGTPYRKQTLQQFHSGKAHFLLGLRHRGAGNGYLHAEIESASVYDRALSRDEVANCFHAGPPGAPYVTQPEIIAALEPDESRQLADLQEELVALQTQVQFWQRPVMTYAGGREQPQATHRLIRGDVTKPAEIVSPAGLAAIQEPASEWSLPPDAPEGQRRLQLANWLADRRHPLTSRVIVNRLWHYHFGRGIVETPNDFGFNGARPSHPELLDWLSSELMQGPPAWSLKRLQRLIVTSATYRQSSQSDLRAMQQDADNVLLWRFTPRRLEGEIVRDTLLAVSGELQEKMGGVSFHPFVVTNFNSDFYQPVDLIGSEYNRRTIYRAHINSGKSALMDALDCPDPSIKTPVRRITTTPLAALALMNNSFVLRQAKSLADRVVREYSDPPQQIRRAYEIALGRAPTEDELKDGLALVQKHRMPALCWVLLNTTEFVYVP